MGNLAAALPVLQAGASIFGGANQAKGFRDEADSAIFRGNLNADLSQMSAADALFRGVQREGGIRRDIRATQGAQRVALAGQGIALDTGNAQDLQSETNFLGEQDILQNRINSRREAFGHGFQALDSRLQGQAQARGAKAKARSSLIGMGLQSANFLKDVKWGALWNSRSE